MPLLRLLLIDPHEKFREAARKYLLRCSEFKSVVALAGYQEGRLLDAQDKPDLILVDSEYLSKNPSLFHDLEKLQQSAPAPDVLALSLFRDEYSNRCRQWPPPVSGYIFKENFAESLFAYLAAKENGFTGKNGGSTRGAD